MHLHKYLLAPAPSWRRRHGSWLVAHNLVPSLRPVRPTELWSHVDNLSAGLTCWVPALTVSHVGTSVRAICSNVLDKLSLTFFRVLLSGHRMGKFSKELLSPSWFWVGPVFRSASSHLIALLRTLTFQRTGLSPTGNRA